MIEDKLTHDERLRLECVAQAIAAGAMASTPAELIVARAVVFEQYVREGGPVR